MANKVGKGGANKAYIYRLKLKSDGTVYEVLDKLTADVAATPTVANAAYVLLGLIGSSKPQIQDTGLVNFSFDQYDAGEDIYSFLNAVATSAEAASTSEVLLEDGAKIGGASGTNEDVVLLISYLHTDDIDTPTKRFVYSAIGTINTTSGSFETSGDAFTKPTFEFVGKTVSLDIDIAVAMYDSALVTVSAAKEIPTGKNFIREFLTIPA